MSDRAMFGVLVSFEGGVADADINDLSEDILTAMDDIEEDDWNWIMWKPDPETLSVFLSAPLASRVRVAEIDGAVIRTAFEMLPVMRRRSNQWIIPSPRSRRQSVEQAMEWFERAFEEQFPDKAEKPDVPAVKGRTKIDSEAPVVVKRPDPSVLIASIRARVDSDAFRTGDS